MAGIIVLMVAAPTHRLRPPLRILSAVLILLVVGLRAQSKT
ncbi:MAG TPA: hypothetical protein VGZ23_04540 [bacterium]|nr:hypothetical protein [bacterium]